MSASVSLHPFLTREPSRDEQARARALHEEALVVDTLGALRPTSEYIERLKAGGINALALTLVAEHCSFRTAMETIAWWNDQLRKWQHKLVLATSADDIRQAKEDGRIAVIYVFQNGRPFEDETGFVELFRQVGVTSSQITYNRRNLLGDGYEEPTSGGLSTLGRQIVAEMNRVGMLVDLSHAADSTAQDIIACSSRPVYYSHSGAQAVHPSPRFASDDSLAMLRANGGTISSTGLYQATDANEPVPLRRVMDHVLYLIDAVGADHVGVSTDFLKAPDEVYRSAFIDDAGFLNLTYPGVLKSQQYDWSGPDKLKKYPWFVYPLGIQSYAEFPNITLELVIRGLDDDVIRGILGENYVRLFGTVVG